MKSSKKWRLSIFIGCLLLFGALFTTGVSASGNGKVVSFNSLDVISKTLPEGEKVIAVTISASHVIDGATLTTDTFEVEGKHNQVASVRTITDIYTNNTGEIGDKKKVGKYIVIELSANDASAGTLSYNFVSGLNSRMNLEYTVTQKEEFMLVGNKKVAPTTEKISQTAEYNQLVDSFSNKTITNESGQSLNYRMFEPKMGKGKKYPLVLALHGAGERGSKNDVHLLGNKTVVSWAEPDQQKKHPAFVVAPQAQAGTWWTQEGNYKLVMQLIEEIKEKYPIDENRIYITGVSMGGMGTWNIIQENPDLFAAAIPVCGIGDVTKASRLVNLPIWVLHSADDAVVRVTGSTDMINAIEAAGAVVTRGEYAGNLDQVEANKAAQSLVDQAKATGSHTLYTEFTAETTPIFNHFSWIPTYENEVVRDWLFAQVKGQ